MASDDVVRFGVDLDAAPAVQGAEAAAGALEALDQQIAADTQSIGAMQRALKNLQGGSAVNIQQFKELKQRIEAKKVTIAQTQARYLELGGTFKKTKKPAEEATQGIEALLGRIQGAGGPLGKMSSKLSALRPLLAAGPYIALAAAVVGAATAFFALTAAVTAYGIGAANAHRNEKLLLDGLVAMPNWFRRTADSAAFLQGQISKVSANNPLARAELGSLADELYRAGLRGDGFAMALEGVSTAQAGGGQKAADYYKSLVVGAGRSTAAIKKFSDDAKARFGGIVTARMLSLDVQAKKLRENIDQLFSGLKIEGFLKGLHAVTELFSQNTSTGKALKVIIESLLQPIIDAVSHTGPIAKRFFQGLVLGALELTIAILRVRLWFRRTFGDSQILKNVDTLRIAVGLGAAAFGFLATAAVVAGATVAAAMLLAASPFLIIGGAIYITISAMQRLWAAGQEAYDYLAGLDWGQLGSNLVDGFVAGIKRGVGAVVKAVKDMGAAARQALREALDSHSPSKAFEKDAFTAPQGAVVAFRKGRPLVAKASAEMGAAARIGFQKAGDGSAPAFGPLPSRRPPPGDGAPPPAAGGLHWSGNLIVQPAAGTPQQQVDDVQDKLLKMLQGVGIAIGADMREE